MFADINNRNISSCNRISICGVGGIPIIQEWNDKFTFNSSVITEDILKDLILKSLGLSAVLTFKNPKNKSYSELGQVCKEYKHTWSFNWFILNLYFPNIKPCQHLSLLRHKEFFSSWTISDSELKEPVVFSGSLKNWLKFSDHYNDESFDFQTRLMMAEIQDLLDKVIK